MLKKILIGLLIIVILGSSFAYYSYKKIEAQFESFILAEVEKKQEAAAKALEDKLAAELAAAEEQSNIEDQISEVDSTEDETADTSDDDTTDVESEDETVSETDGEIQSGAGSEDTKTDDSSNETDTSSPTDTSSQNDSSSQNDTTGSDADDSTTEETPTEETPVVEKQPEVKEPEEVEVVEEEPYTKEDFERDKKIALDLAMSRLSGSQISRLIDISADGFTPTEKQEAKEMFYSNFTDAEQDWILGIYEKYYGLVSEG